MGGACSARAPPRAQPPPTRRSHRPTRSSAVGAAETHAGGGRASRVHTPSRCSSARRALLAERTGSA
eukprot:955445-Pleurochrysis_carterae.AAC.1